LDTGINKYVYELKKKLDGNFLSPLFVRLANLFYLNEEYEECIELCKTGLKIYPDYLTAKLVLLKALLKMEYLTEAENLFEEITPKIKGMEIHATYERIFTELRKLSGQEKIYYPLDVKNKIDFKLFESTFDIREFVKENLSLEEVINEPDIVKSDDFIDKESFGRFLNEYDSLAISAKLNEKNDDLKVVNQNQLKYYKLKIITETIADLYAKQGNFREAFEAYNILLKLTPSNQDRISQKIFELERIMANKIN
jgi:tetratricopeptide (TPR) repeat protein